MKEAREELHILIDQEELQDAFILIMANKQDLPTAMPINEIENELGLFFLDELLLYIQGTCANTGDGLAEGLNFLIKNISQVD
eukprot:CAMPEP_0205800764 /NCGR_PEP_ID=MMETSP0205-20121125/2537_1 /ASSEMBLY_ACC=CAM_ASM_000278 /TAXON_ID=36767 /ORGANISM="Euplotes focardii, Strain TN1" /LENGTH=82 /DNA_ID=CAMNT_0053064407 /DNA_START=237 /DNA_END=482 /DNA_ORIENTATION=-